MEKEEKERIYLYIYILINNQSKLLLPNFVNEHNRTESDIAKNKYSYGLEKI